MFLSLEEKQQPPPVKKPVNAFLFVLLFVLTIAECVILRKQYVKIS